MEHTTHPLDYVSALRRRRWWLVVPIVAAVLVGGALLTFLPRQYQAEATLGVTAPAVSPTLVNQAALFDNQDRLRALRLQLLSDSVLERTIAEEGGGTGEAALPHINDLRRNVKIAVPDPVARTVDDSRRLDAFRITYTSDDPAWAQRVTNRLATVFIEENSNTRTSSAEKSSEYLEAEQQSAHARLTELEGRLRSAKEAFIGRLPEQTQANLQTLTSLRQQLEVNGTSLRHQQERLSMVQRQIEAMEQDAAKGLTLGGGATHASQRVASLEAELATARGMYTDKHPEVQRLEAELKSALQEVVAPQPRVNSDLKARLQVDPGYRQLLADREMTTLAIRELERGAVTMRTQITDYQRRVEAAPMVEQQLAAVQREYNLAQQQYAEVTNRLATASLAENVARNRDSEQFSMIFPASLPTEPVSPIPSRVMLMAVMAGICLGAALALGREYLDSSVHSTRDLADEFDLPVLGEVAHVPASSR
jgi:polysaccharide chain length determinant protein (PEP-CTERM system associated)